jgi:hypothetical protein
MHGDEGDPQERLDDRVERPVVELDARERPVVLG